MQKKGFINLLALIVMGAAGFATARYANSFLGQVTSFYIGLGVLVALVSWFQMRLAERERLEKLEFEELSRSRSSTALFETKEAEAFPARRSREQFERFFVPAFTAVLLLLQAGGAFLLMHWLVKRPVAGLCEPMVAMALLALVALVLFLLGKFSATLARLEDSRLLRPSAAYLLLGAYLSFVAALAIAAAEAGFPKTDFYVARVLCVLLAVIAAETLITLILEIYRPRVKGRVARPLYDSRLVGLLGQPEGLITTATQALDYQFGFKVSETWFYRFLEKALAWLLLLQLGALLLSTCVVFVEPGQQGLLERFGKRVEGRELLGPGGHLKLPWPVDRVYLYRTDQIQSFFVGMTPDPEMEKLKTVLWTVEHAKKEENFLVASRMPAEAEGTNSPSGRRIPPVSLLAVNIPVQFRITNLIAWAYNNDNPAALLERLATREVVRHLVSADMQEIMARGRLEAAQALRKRIQAAADDHRLGAEIMFVGLEGIHPPIKVAPDYEKVVGAIQAKQAKILVAQADAIRTNALAGARAFQIVNEASAERQRRELNALAQAALFTNQLPAWQAAPSIYLERAYLQTFARAVSGARKYLVLTTNTEDVIQFDLQDRIRQDLLDLTVPPSKRAGTSP